MDRSPGRRLTPEEKEQIVELRLRGMSVRKVADAIPTTTSTVQREFKKYLRARADEFREETDPIRAHLIERLFRIANDAARAAKDADDGLRSRYLAEERQALAQVAKFFEGPIQIEHSGDLGYTVVRIVEERPGEGE